MTKCHAFPTVPTWHQPPKAHSRVSTERSLHSERELHVLTNPWTWRLAMSHLTWFPLVRCQIFLSLPSPSPRTAPSHLQYDRCPALSKDCSGPTDLRHLLQPQPRAYIYTLISLSVVRVRESITHESSNAPFLARHRRSLMGKSGVCAPTN